ncbi:DUF3320 domain-containing protein [Photobacterium sanguinicancri]|uniref:DUF3320 domain-containing protein n=1 Tax=Photobacterium sanguinicancri TaxID=875932 RepID=UPI0026E14A3B|nr:DUF3320 domain-containing protein [Photobacterium sanguinicancri]MDO6496810.1 DUF3320 domain-containing protein [Photobacterium sanguinicancri]
MNSNLKQIFDKSRQELLDMGLRGNTLLSLSKGAKVLDIVDEKTGQVFDLLVEQSKTMSFLPAPNALETEESKLISLKELTDHLEEQRGEKRHADASLQTQLFKKALDTRLLKLNSEAITFVQEQGVDLLYLATGFLKWYEDENSDKPRYAPLVLIPVEIYRADAGDSYKIRYTDAELGTNLTLAAKLKMEFGILLPSFEENDDGYDIQAYFEKVTQAISTENKWSVEHDRMALSFFSFGKFQMYQDLSDEAWPEGKKPSENVIIEKLFSDGFEKDTNILDSTPMDVNRVEEIQLVLDSDSSQTEAVLAARTGSSLIIQGPPGTGKSQTITNIISQALADNKKVLFVAEKMAALDVVKRRLDNCHIGDSVLELHSHKANKKSVLSSLESTLLQHAPVSPERSEDIGRLVSLRNKLDDYCAVVNQPIKNTGVSYHTALGYSLQLEELIGKSQIELESLPATDFDLNVWDSQYYYNTLAKIIELVDYLDEHQAPSLNLFSSTRLQEYSPASDKQATKLVEQLALLHQDIVENIIQLHGQAGCESQLTNYEECTLAFEALKVIAERPELDGVSLDKEMWSNKGDSILKFAMQGISLQDQKSTLSQQFMDTALDYDWLPIRGTLVTTGQKWWRFLSGDFRQSKNTYTGMCKSGLTGSVNDWVQQIDSILEYKSTQRAFVESAQLAIQVIGGNFKNTNTDWKALFAPLQWINQCHHSLKNGRFDQGLERFLDPKIPVSISQNDLKNIEDKLALRTQVLQAISELLALDVDTFQSHINTLSINDTERLILDIQHFYPLTRFNRLSEQLNELGLAKWSELAFTWAAEPQLLREGFKYRFFNHLVNEQYQTKDEIRNFDRVEHEKQIEQFTSIDSQLFHFAQETLVKQLFDNLPNPAARGEVETLRREFNKKRRQMPIRRLLNKAGRVVQQIKPVFMMSPMSIATYLEPGVVDFDLVIFDEASQVKVADALGAILRGKQVIVVGDTKQMPPTNFFGKQFIADDEEAEESLTADMESILGMFLASGTPERMLKWHYRSRHESLIAVSNQEFYDNKLMIFPSSGINPHAKGLIFNYLPETTYDRGGSRSNVGEASAVAQAVIQHAKDTPLQTLGVVAFSTAQRDAILLEVERLRKENPDLEHFFGEHEEGEDFFVKNLENVQGDERDTIFISIGYGKTPEGRLPMSFGPLNSDGGERRLNVLISRARMCMNVFSNFKAEEMPTTEASPFGVRSLKNFLHFADTGDLVKREETGKEPDSPFEEEVISSIRGLGYQVQPQVGCAGFYIDIAVRDPNKPGRYMLAVECDGATYHSSKSARDRDRIRQSVLEGLGWRFHRIWSTDWFRNRHKETLRLDDAIKEAIAYYNAYDAEPAVQQQNKQKDKAKIERVEVEHQNSVTQYQACVLSDLGLREGWAIPDLSTQKLAEDIRKVVKIESPIHIKQLNIRLLSAVGASRSGARINRAILDAIGLLNRQGEVNLEGEFILLTAQSDIIVRNRAALPSNERKFDLIYDGEITVAAIDTVRDTYSISHDDLIKSITEVLGFSSTSKAMKIRVESILKELESSSSVIVKGDTYQVINC